MEPGGTVQFRLFEDFTDGTSRDVTNEATWSTAWWGLTLSSAAPGLMTAPLRFGSAYLSAGVNGRFAEATEVMVLPPGTYKLTGYILEAYAPISVPVTGARVEIAAGPHAGAYSNSSLDGDFYLYGVPRDAQLRVSKAGYSPLTLSLTVVNHQQILRLELPSESERTDVSGTYQLTISAGKECGVGLGQGQLPEDARLRTYTARVNQQGPFLGVTLDGPSFQSAAFGGRVEPGRLLFDLRWLDGEGPRVIEQLGPSTFLILHGTVEATASSNRIVGSFFGDFHIRESLAAGSNAVAWCSGQHRFEMSR